MVLILLLGVVLGSSGCAQVTVGLDDGGPDAGAARIDVNEGPRDASAHDANDLDASDGPDVDMTAAAIAFCRAQEEARAQLMARCLGGGIDYWRLREESRRASAWSCESMEASDVATARMGFDPSKADACFEGLDHYGCAYALFKAEAWDVVSGACFAPFFPRVPAGGACQFTSECLEGTYCDSPFAQLTCTNRCLPKLAPGDDGSCVAYQTDCGPGRACIGLHCTDVPARVHGDPCPFLPCVSPLVCTAQGCALPSADGEPCAPAAGQGWGADLCASPGSTCDLSLRICVPARTAGSTCTASHQDCALVSRCLPDATGTSICSLQHLVGEACDPGIGADCAQELACIAHDGIHTCERRRRVGQPCASVYDCDDFLRCGPDGACREEPCPP